MRPWTVFKAVVGYFVFLAPLLVVVWDAVDLAVSHRKMSPTWVRDAQIILSASLALFLLFNPWRRALWDWRKARRWHLGVWRDIFARSLASKAALAGRASALTTERLLACYKWPEHTATATAIIKQELLSRGVAEDTIEHWLPPAANVTVPLTASFGWHEAFRRLEVLEFWIGRVLGFIGLAGLAGLILSVILIPFMPRSALDALASMFGTGLLTMLLSWGTLLLGVLPIGTVTGLVRTKRILLLRPFDQQAMTRTLKRIVLRHLGPVSHVFTLSDIDYRPNPFIRLGDMIATGGRYAVSMMVRPSIRIATVRNARTYLAFAARVRGRLKASARHFITGGQAYNIKSTDAWWKWCIDLLMHSTDAVVMDISRVSTGSAWEIDHMLVRDALPRTIFIAQEAYEEHGRQALSRILGDAPLPPVFLYSAAGQMKEPAAFSAALAAKLAAPQRAAQQPAALAQPTAALPQTADLARPNVAPEPQAAAARRAAVPQLVGAGAIGAVAALLVAGAFGWFMLRGGEEEVLRVPDPPPLVSEPPPLNGGGLIEMPGILLVTSDYLFFDGPRGGPFGRSSYMRSGNPTRLSASGRGFSWSVVEPVPDWLYVFPMGGYLPGNGTITVSIWPSSGANLLRPGTYDARIAFRTDNDSSIAPLDVPVTLTVE